MADRLKVLLSAYACEPGRGSEPEVGWQWAIHLAQLHDVTVVTRSNNREPIEHGLAALPQPHPKFIYFDLSARMQSAKRAGLPVALYYFLWQRAVAKFVAPQLAEFDLIHHITFNSFRQPGSWRDCGKPIVLGPLGGVDALAEGTQDFKAGLTCHGIRGKWAWTGLRLGSLTSGDPLPRNE